MKRQSTLIALFAFVLLFLGVLFPENVQAQQPTWCCCQDCPGFACIDLMPGDIDCNDVCATQMCTFSGAASTNPFCTGTPCQGMLPVELISFTSKVKNEGVLLSWQTGTEINNKGFEVQRSTGIAIDWEFLDFVPGHGNTSEVKEYSYLDNKPVVGTNYYRLKQIDFDEGYTYSEVESASVEGPVRFDLWPTLVEDRFIIKSSFDESVTNTLEIFDMMGKEIMTQQFDQYLTINVSTLPRGNYVARIRSDDKIDILRFTKI